METSGPAIARDVTGPLRRLVTGPARSLPVPRGIIFRYAAPLGLLLLLGLAVANQKFLRDTRGLDLTVAALLSVAAVLPVAVAVHRPLLAWRLAYPVMFLGPLGAAAGEAWPWPPVQLIAYLVVMFALAATEDSALTVWAAAAGAVVPFLWTDPANAFGMVVLMTVVTLLGDVLSRRRTSRARLAEQTELTELERSRRAVLEERTRIAREMHDVVAHHMSMIAVRAETAPYRLTGLSDAARAELAGIATSARGALADMRRLLGVLRSDVEEAPRAPQPGLADLDDLAATARRAGVPVTLATSVPDPVPGAAGLAAYRIVQEALANAARHAPGGPVEITVRGRPGSLDLSVRNGPGGPAEPSPGGGHGLVGMRERAALLGGTLSAGPDDRGGYLVEATLPHPEEPGP